MKKGKQPRNGKSAASSGRARSDVARAASNGVKRSAGAANWPSEVGTLYKPIKKPITLRLDADILAWFKAPGKGYQTRINRALRALVQGKKRGASRA